MAVNLSERLEAMPLRRFLLASLVVLAAFYAFLVGLYFGLHGSAFIGSESYSDIARQYVESGRFESAYRPPLYPLLLAYMMMLFLSRWEAATIATQVILAMMSGGLVAAIAFRLTGRRLAAAVALFLFLCDAMLQLEVVTKRETILYVTILLALTFQCLGDERSGWRQDASMAFLAGLSHLVRPTGVLPLAVLLFVLFDSRDATRRHVGWRLATVTTILFLTILPWQLTMSRITGRITFASSVNSGLALWKGNNPDTDNIFPFVDLDYAEPWINKMVADASVTGSGVDDFLKQRAVAYIENNPWQFLRRCVEKAFVLLSPVPTPFGTGTLKETNGRVSIESFKPRNLGLAAFNTLYALLITWGGITFLRAFGSTNAAQRRFFWFSALTVTLTVGVHSLTFSETRYRLPLDPFLMIAAATMFSGLEAIPGSRRQRSAISDLAARQALSPAGQMR